MTTAQLVFLYTAEELNITKAAQRAFISQQCASNHIRKLEEEYGTVLFLRKPTLALTPEGKCLADALRQMLLIEQNAAGNIREMAEGRQGSIRLSINPSRFRILLPQVLEHFSRKYPHVKISVEYHDTYRSMELLDKGKVDLVLGVNASIGDGRERYHITPVCRDKVYFVASRALVDQYIPDFDDRLDEHGRVSLSTLAPLPFCLNLKGSTLAELINYHLSQQHLSLNIRYNISDYDTQLELCAAHMAATFCPSMILRRVEAWNRLVDEDRRVVYFQIQEVQEELAVEFIRNAYFYQSGIVEEFVRAVCQEAW